MPANVPVPSHVAGDIFTASMWTDYIQANINKLLNQGHRVLTVATFLALTGLEDGDEAYVEVDGTNGIQWALRYHLASTKWRCIGGPPLIATVATDQSGAAATYGDLATAGPSVTIPLTGTYDLDHGATVYNTGAAGTHNIAPSLAGAGPADTDLAGIGGGTASMPSTATTAVRIGRSLRITATAADSEKLQYKSSSASGHFKDRQIGVRIVHT